jgi:hypothetical protein
MKASADLIRKAGRQESSKGISEIEGKAARVGASESGRVSNPVLSLLLLFSRFAICVRATDYRIAG